MRGASFKIQLVASKWEMSVPKCSKFCANRDFSSKMHQTQKPKIVPKHKNADQTKKCAQCQTIQVELSLQSRALKPLPLNPLCSFFSLSHTEKCWMIRRKAGEVGANVTLRQAQMWPLSHLHWYRFVTGIAGQVIFFWFPNLQRTLGISRVKVEVWDVDINQWHHVAQGFRTFFLRCWVGPAMVSVGFYCLRPEQACQCIFLVCLGLHSPSTILCVPKWCGSWKV